MAKLGHFFGMAPPPIGIENPLERLAAVHRRMEELRASYQAIRTIGLMEMPGLGTQVAQAWA